MTQADIKPVKLGFVAALVLAIAGKLFGII